MENSKFSDNNATRSVNSAKNITTNLIVSVLTLVLSFVSRSIFIKCLATDYLGLNGLFSNILGFLSLSELGIGSAMTFALYKPVKDDNTEKIKTLMYEYKRMYKLVGFIIFTAGLIITPFIHLFIKEGSGNVPHIRLFFLIYLSAQAISYLFSYKSTLIICMQKEYILTLIRGTLQIIRDILQIIFLITTHSYLPYLLIMVANAVLENICISYKADKMYPLLLDTDVQPLAQEEKLSIRKNIYALVFHNIGTKLVFSSDNIIISKFIGLKIIGFYSNYTLIITSINRIVDKVLNSLVGSVGNLLASESKEHSEKVFYHILFANSWIYGFVSTCFICLMQPFISLWIGSKFLLSNIVLFLAVISFYVTGMRRTLLIFKGAAGIYEQDKYKPLIEGIVNIIVSVILVLKFGIAGVIAGTIISTLSIAFWFEAYVFFKCYYNKSMFKYLLKQIKYLFFNAASIGVTYLLCSLMKYNDPGNNLFIVLIVRAIICVFVPNVLYILVFNRTEDFKYFIDITKRLLLKRK